VINLLQYIGMKKFFPILFYILIGINFAFSSWYVLHDDITFSADIGRDFLLFQEIDSKKIILIGPRSSTSGLFHGPLWLYINYPAYLIGQGNPVTVGWWWVLLSAFFTLGCFFVGKNLFGKTTGYLFALMISAYMFFHVHSFINPHGAMFVLPFFFFFFIKYFQKHKLRDLFMHVFLGGIMVQFQMAVGIPFLVLSFLAVAREVVLRKKFLHIFTFLFALIPLSTFILFDLRHQFILAKGVLDYVSPAGNNHSVSFVGLLMDRARLMFSGVEILRVDPGYRNLILFFILLAFIVLQMKHKKHTLIYSSFLYFYFGFFLLSFINKGTILYFYLYPIFPLVFMMFASLITSKYKRIFAVIFFVVYLMNINSIILDVQQSKKIIGKNIESWKFLHTTAAEMFKGKEKEVGYFVYAPDSFAYAPKYAAYYAGKESGKQRYNFTKKAVTYVLAEPPPPNNPYMQSSWWIENEIHIKKKPISVKKFENGYAIYKYTLTDDEILVPISDGADLGIHFR
jgi:hypothetical protein